MIFWTRNLKWVKWCSVTDVIADLDGASVIPDYGSHQFANIINDEYKRRKNAGIRPFAGCDGYSPREVSLG
jgi:hypothetical protein